MMKLALVHDWIGTMGGAEQVLARMHRLWPDAPIFTLWANRRTVAEHFPSADIRTSGLQRVPAISRLYPLLGPVMPAAMEGFDLSAYDTVLSNSVSFAKGVVVRPGTRHVSYCYSPTRMLWDRAGSYERRGFLSVAARHLLRSWDQSAGQRPDRMLAISRTAADRIEKYYRRTATVVPPPVDAAPADQNLPTERFFLAVGRLVPHKMLQVTIDACVKTHQRLVIVGDGPLYRSLRRHAGPSVTFLGWQGSDPLDRLYRRATALIVANDEDFGLTAVEAMARGTPVLALRAGGATETVLEGVTGEFFDDAIPEAVAEGIMRIRRAAPSYDRAAIRQHAAQWSTAHWESSLRSIIDATD